MNELPVIGFGTWVDVQGGQETVDIVPQVQAAYAIGYRHFDTAENYGTEKLVQEALMTLIVDGAVNDRSSFFVTTKYRSGNVPSPSDLYRRHLVGGIPVNEVPPQDLAYAQPTGVPGVVGGFQLVSEETTQVDFGYFDLILLHNPPLTSNQNEFERRLLNDWNRLITLQRAGYAKHIGVSNFYARQLGILIDLCTINGLPRPYVNEIELHLWCQMPDLVAQCQGYGVMVIAHTPLGGLASGWLLQREDLQRIAVRLNATPAQVALAYLIRQGAAVIPKSTQPDRMRENLEAIRLVDDLTLEDLNVLRSIDIGQPLIELSQTAWSLDQQLQ